MRSGTLGLLLGALLLAIVAYATVAAIAPPEVRGVDAPPTEFSAARALAHVEAISQNPHPVGSPAHEDVRAYILQTLAGLGLESRVQDSRAALKAAGVTHAAHVMNVLARLPGTHAGPAVLLAAHYDSVPQSHGASDDGSGVATLLETARALLAGPRLQNDVLFLFTDAEEVAMCGALAFTDEELAKNPIAVAMNFEARGTGGAVALYDTSKANGALIEALARVAPRVVSTSLLGSLAQILPNDSDATIWKRAGIPTYAFAYVEHLYQYHQSTDSVASLDPRSLQHDGEYALPLARHFGNATLPLPELPGVVYFDVFGRAVVSYSAWAARVLALLTIGLVFVLFRQRLQDGSLTIRGALRGALFCVAALLLALLLGGLVHFLLSHLVDHFVLFARPLTACVTAALLAATGVLLWARQVVSAGRVTDSMFGVLGLWCLALIVLATFAPGASFIVEWPLLFAAIGSALWLRFRDEGNLRMDAAVTAALTAALVPVASFWSYLAYTIYVMIGMQTPELVALTVAVPLLLGLPLLERIGAGGVRHVATAVAAAAVLVLVLGVVSLRSASDLPRPDNLEYVIEGSRRLARWTTTDEVHDSFVAQRIAAGQRSAKAEKFDVPELLTRTNTVDEAGQRHGTLDVTPPAHARCVRMWELSRDPVLRARVNDKDVVDIVRFSPELDEKLMRLVAPAGRQAGWVLEYCGLDEKGFKLELFWPRGKPMKLLVQEVFDGFPGPPLTPRSATDGYPDTASDTTNVMVDVSF